MALANGTNGRVDITTECGRRNGEAQDVAHDGYGVHGVQQSLLE